MAHLQRILIIEAGAPLQMGLLRQFARWGFVHVNAVPTGAEGLRQAAVHRPDLVLLTAPKTDSEAGFDFAHRLQAQYGSVPVLVLVPETWRLHQLPDAWPGILSSRCVPKPPTLEQLQHGVEASLHLSLADLA